MEHHVKDLGNINTAISLPVPTKLIFLLETEIILVKHQSTLSKWLFSVVLWSYVFLDVVFNLQLSEVCTSLNLSFFCLSWRWVWPLLFGFFLSDLKSCLTVSVFQRLRKMDGFDGFASLSASSPTAFECYYSCVTYISTNFKELIQC